MIRTAANSRNQTHNSLADMAFASLSGRDPITELPDRNTDWIAVAESAFDNNLIVPANSGDHPMLMNFLRSVIQAPLDVEFEHILDRPDYDASQRLLVRHHGEIIGHVRMDPREIRFGDVTLATIDLSEFAILPEFNSDAFRRILLAAVRKTAASAGAHLITTRDAYVDPTRIIGWTEVNCGANWMVTPRDLVAEVEGVLSLAGRTPWQQKYEVRPWRYVETDDVASIYEANSQGRNGSPVRSDDYWRWMLGRRGFDRAYVAVDTENDNNVAAYVFQRNNHVVELGAAAEHDEAKLGLLRRVSLDAVERGNHSMTLSTASLPTGLFMTDRRRDLRNVTLFGRVILPQAFLKHVAAEVAEKAIEAGLKVGTKLGIVTDNEVFSVTLQKRGLKITSGEKCRSQITLSTSMMSKVLLGACDLEEATKVGRVVASTRIAIGIAAKLFAKRDFIRTALDDQPALG